MDKLLRLINISKETIRVAKESIPIIADISSDHIPFDQFDNYRYFLSRLAELIEGVVFSDNASLNELAQTTYEFLDTLRSTIILVSNFKKIELESIKFRIDKLIIELNAPPFLQHRKRTSEHPTETSDESLQEDKSDEDFTEPALPK